MLIYHLRLGFSKCRCTSY